MSHILRRPIVSAACALGAAATMAVTPAGTAHAATYTFESVADSTVDSFDPSAFGCAAINNTGQVAFRAGRFARDGFNTVPGVYRANADNSLSVIADNRYVYDFIGYNPSMNDAGVVSFAALIDGGAQDDFEAILVGAGGNRVGTVADTRGEFRFFGFGTSINNRREVAFTAELDGTGQGLFSGRRGGPVTTHYLNSTSPFGGTDSRPSINDSGNIAVTETVDFDEGIFVGQEGRFRTVVRPSADTELSEPILNNEGMVAFYRSFSEGDEFVSEIGTVSAAGTRTVVADTRGSLSGFGFRPPALNDEGQVAYLGFLDDFVTGTVMVGSETVVSTGDTLDGDTVVNLVFCEEGLNDSGQLTFVATLEDPTTGDPRTAVFRATPGATFSG